MDHTNIGKRIIELAKSDLDLRTKLMQEGKLGDGYNQEMEALHKMNTKVLNEIIDSIGYPSIDKVGQAASAAAWLIIQHSIGDPEFMKKCKRLLEKAVKEQKANPKNLAYLTDRIAVFEGHPQLYGTQFDWDEKGALSPQLFDDLAKVNQRRQSIGLNTLEEQIIVMRQRVKEEKECPPVDFEKRKKEFEEWRKLVGWVK